MRAALVGRAKRPRQRLVEGEHHVNRLIRLGVALAARTLAGPAAADGPGQSAVGSPGSVQVGSANVAPVTANAPVSVLSRDGWRRIIAGERLGRQCGGAWQRRQWPRREHEPLDRNRAGRIGRNRIRDGDRRARRGKNSRQRPLRRHGGQQLAVRGDGPGRLCGGARARRERHRGRREGRSSFDPGRCASEAHRRVPARESRPPPTTPRPGGRDSPSPPTHSIRPRSAGPTPSRPAEPANQ